MSFEHELSSRYLFTHRSSQLYLTPSRSESNMSSSLLVKIVVYKVLWEPRVCETFIVVHETRNEHDRHAMAFYQDEKLGVIVGHLPWEIAKTCRVQHSTTHYMCRWKVLRKPGNCCGWAQRQPFEEISLLLKVRSWVIAFYNNFASIICQCTCQFSHEQSTESAF